MDARSVEHSTPAVEGDDAVAAAWLVSPRQMFEIAGGGHLELVSEFEATGAVAVEPDRHPTHVFLYLTAGRGLLTLRGEDQEVGQGDLVHIPPDTPCHLRPISEDAPIHCFRFAAGIAPAS